MPTLDIVMCTYNGAAFIDAQLQSFVDQTHADWRLWVSDDHSTDATRDKITAFAQAHPDRRIHVVDGPGQGSAVNFLSVVARSELAGAWVAFSDQDDVWFPDKLSRAVAMLRATPNAVYAARTLHTDAELNVTKGSPRHRRPYGFGNALVQNVLGGNTMVIPPGMTDILRQSLHAAQLANVQFHDWWVYLVATGVGATIINDAEPALYYRQHADNIMGAAVDGKLSRLQMLRSREYAGWIDRNVSALDALTPLLTPDNAALLARFCAWRTKPALLRRAPQAVGLYRQTLAGNAVLRALARIGRI